MTFLRAMATAALIAAVAGGLRAETLEAAKQDAGVPFGELLGAPAPGVRSAVSAARAAAKPDLAAPAMRSGARRSLRPGEPPGPKPPHHGPKKRWSALLGAGAGLVVGWVGAAAAAVLIGGAAPLFAGAAAALVAGTAAGAGLGYLRGARGKDLKKAALAGTAGGAAAFTAAAIGVAAMVLYALSNFT